MKKFFYLLLILSFLGVRPLIAGTCPAKLPVSRVNGTVPGVPVAGGTQYYFKDALLQGFDCFEQLSDWFPDYQSSPASISPTHVVVDMAYTEEGTATFSNVVVPATGIYTMDIRYAFDEGLFPKVENRPEGVMVNGVLITSDMNFPVTGSFETYADSSIEVPLNQGVNTIQLVNIASASISRADSMTITAGGLTNACHAAPATPSGLTAAAVSGASTLNLNWTASTAPLGCSVGYYNVYRSTTPGFMPTGSNQIASTVLSPTYSDSSAVCETPYYYAVVAVDTAGQSTASAQASVTSGTCPTVGSAQIDAGGAAENPFIADIDFSGGSTNTHNNPIDVSGVSSPAPAAVYQSVRSGNFTYTLSGFSPNSTHTVRLHFAETYFGASGQRTFNVTINGAQVLTNFDIFANAGAKNKAYVAEFPANASSTGAYVITFSSVVNNSEVSGIEVQ